MKREHAIAIIIHEYYYQSIKAKVYTLLEATIFCLLSVLSFTFYCLFVSMGVNSGYTITCSFILALVCLCTIVLAPWAISRKAERRAEFIEEIKVHMPVMRTHELSLYAENYASWVFDENGFIDETLHDAALLMLNSSAGERLEDLPGLTRRQRLLAWVMRRSLR
ncbi:TPA: hypothetical protein KEY88_003435 [Serratia marcescens]|nr:hypothetical protein [Serratia marcescens]